MMEQAKKYGDILVVIVKPDIAIKNKGLERPIINENDRVEQVDSIKYVDYTILANQNINESNLNSVSEIQTARYYEIVKNLHPNVLVHPTNHKIPDVLLNLYKELNTEIIEIPRNDDKPSTTQIIDKIRKYRKLGE
jgi:D-beta-D-heptose 7-phosphate kinase/D-beta-D-heptose 1-phosphate adenosyltransferase